MPPVPRLDDFVLSQVPKCEAPGAPSVLVRITKSHGHSTRLNSLDIAAPRFVPAASSVPCDAPCRHRSSASLRARLLKEPLWRRPGWQAAAGWAGLRFERLGKRVIDGRFIRKTHLSGRRPHQNGPRDDWNWALRGCLSRKDRIRPGPIGAAPRNCARFRVTPLELLESGAFRRCRPGIDRTKSRSAEPCERECGRCIRSIQAYESDS